MIQVFHNTNFRLMWRTKYVFLAVSGLVLVAAVWAMISPGFNLGIDFAGGTAVQVKFRVAPRVEVLRASLEAADLGDVNIQRIGERGDNEVLIRVEQQRVQAGEEGGEISSEILEALRTPEDREAARDGGIDLNLASEAHLREWIAGRLGEPAAAAAGGPAGAAAALIRARNARGGIFTDMSEVEAVEGLAPAVADLLRDEAYLGEFVVRGVDFVGPTAGKELLHKTGFAILGSVLGILIYVWFRFHKIAWGVAALAALVHDVTVAAGAMAFTGKEISLPVVAAFLTIVGYSINDTIVIFDRIRENLRLFRDRDFEEVTNASINQTLSRSVLTSFTAFIAVTALYLYGGEKLNPLSFCLMVGVVVGSYSSIFIAAALLVLAHRFLGARHVKA